MCLVSVIVPIYNLESIIKKCIDSIRNQTVQSVEIILVNDGSTDKTIDILKKCELIDSRIKLIDIPNGGVEHARLVGLENSSGEYVMFVDGDDYLPNNAIELLLNNAKLTDADIVIGNMERVIGNKGWIKIKSPIPHENEVIKEPELFNEYYISFFGVNIIPVNMCGKLYKKEIFSINGLPPLTGLNHAEDLCFNMHLFPNINSVSIIPDTVYYYRYGGMTNKMNTNLFKDACIAYELKLKYLDKYQYKKGYIFIAIELINFLNTYIESYFKYTDLSRIEVCEIIKNEINNFSFKDALIKISNSKYIDKRYQLLLENKILDYINTIILNEKKLKYNFKIKEAIIKIVGNIF